jgi:serine/threonine protein kinase
MSLTAGSQLGPYTIVAPLGAGGMGEVYRATDTRLKRQVAIKILSTSLAADPERLARFQREAEVLAALNHPNIAAIYGLEGAGGAQALVMELVEGPTLADRIAQGPVPYDEALPIATQMADALEAAHERGIVHRDLKPANIKVRDDGTVKVLDFGLAKLGESGSSSRVEVDPSQSPTLVGPVAVTGVNVILGTAAYMSPEQARGRAVDKRTDVWAFGAVLYEMLTGQCAFDGQSQASVIAQILTVEPRPVSELVPTHPPALDRVVRRCLAKDPDERWQSAGDLKAELRWIAEGGTESEAVSSKTAWQVQRKINAKVKSFLLTPSSLTACIITPEP